MCVGVLLQGFRVASIELIVQGLLISIGVGSWVLSLGFYG